MKILEVRVKPNARASRLIQRDDGSWLAEVQSSPVDGDANRELLELVSRELGLRKNQVSLKRGARGRTKWIEIEE